MAYRDVKREKISFETDGHTDRQTETQVHVLSCAFAAKNHYLFAWRTFIVSAGSRSCSFRAVVVRSDGLLNIAQGLRVLVYLKDRTLC